LEDNTVHTIERLTRKPARPKTIVTREESRARAEWARANLSGRERLLRRVRQQSTRPKVTCWETEDGAWIVRRGDTKIRTGQCPQCRTWFRAVRRASVRTRWPSRCSTTCNQAAERGQRRRRRAAGLVEPVVWRYPMFDPDAPDAYWTAMAIADDTSVRSSPAEVYAKAVEYLAACEDDTPEQDEWS
jgi:hypothetical protein